MSVSTKVKFAHVDDLYLDPQNPRLGRKTTAPDTPQSDLLEETRSWTLDELAWSYLESGEFWTHEAVVAVKDKLYGSQKLVVVEGNRRLAALKFLQSAFNGEPASTKWAAMIADYTVPENLFDQVPYLLADSREDVQAFLGFRHVTGIKQWDADEKAAFIARLIEQRSMSYQEVARKIGSKTPTVRKHYVAYRVLLQMEEHVEGIDETSAEDRFAALYMSVDTTGAQKYLHIKIDAPPNKLLTPVPKRHLRNLVNFARWLFGTEDCDPIVTDTRQVADFGAALEDQNAVEYLESTAHPKLEVAYRIAGGDEEETINYVHEAANSVQLALMRAHAFKRSTELKKAVTRLGTDTLQLLSIFPAIKTKVVEEADQ